jgi:hypothetical protein
MKSAIYIQIACYVAFIVLLFVSAKVSYTMGINDGKILMCISQDAYLINDIEGEHCISKNLYTNLTENTNKNVYDIGVYGELAR